jgi:outer membrane protein, heavy metal efflux system
MMLKMSWLNNLIFIKGIPVIGLMLAFLVQLSAQVYPYDYLQQASENNPALRASFFEYEAASLQPDVVGALSDPELSVGIFTPPMQRLMGDQLFDASLMQMFPWFGSLRNQRRAAESRANAALQIYRNQRNNLFLEITSLWFEIYETRQMIQLTARFRDILREREELIYSRYEAGMGGQAVDIYRLELQVNELENRMEYLSEQEISQVRSFNLLLNRDPLLEVEVPDTLLPIQFREEMQLPDSAGLMANPMAAIAAARELEAEYQQAVERLMTRPMLGLGVQYSYFAPGEAEMMQMDGGSMIMPMVSITLPIYARRNRATRQMAGIMTLQASQRTLQQLNELSSDWVRIMAEQNNLNRDLTFLERQININELAWELILTGYGGGQARFDELLQLQDSLLELEVRRLQSLVRQHQLAVEKDWILGREVFE